MKSISHEYDSKLKKLEDELRRNSEIEILEIKGSFDTKIELLKLKVGPYSEKQFEIYNELWAKLCELKHSMLLLWEGVSNDTFQDFSKRLEETTKALEKSALVIEEDHYVELMDILNTFATYETDKGTLIELWKLRGTPQQIEPSELKKMIKENREIKKKLLDILPQMRVCLRKQISGMYNQTEQML